MPRAGCAAGMLSASKLYQSVSTSGPSATVKPMPMKTSTSRSQVCVTKCSEPRSGRSTSSVRSSRSAATVVARSAASSSERREANAASSDSRASFNAAPATLRPSGSSPPMPFLSAVSSPFFPRRSASTARSSSTEVAAAIRAGPSAPIRLMSSIIGG